MAVRKSSGFNKILIVVCSIAFGLIALAVGYQAVQNSTEQRSKAAEDSTEYKRWDFTKTVEGWSTTTLASLSAVNGTLSARIGSSRGFLYNPAVNVSLPTGNKYIAFRMAVVPNNTTPVLGDQTDCAVDSNGVVTCEGSVSSVPGSVGGGGAPGGTALNPPTYITAVPCVPKPTCAQGNTCREPQYYPQGGWCPPTTNVTPAPCVPEPTCAEGTKCAKPLYYPQGGWCPPTPSQTPKPFVFSILYWLEKDDLTKPPKAAPVEFRGTADGAMKEYTVRFAEIGSLGVKQVRFRFDSGVAAGDQVRFDWIKILGPMIKPTPTQSCRPAPICQAGKPCPKYYPQDGWCKSTPSPTPTLSCRPVPPCPAGKPCPLYYPRDGWCPTRPPTTPPTSTGYRCPASGWVDCMPIMDNAKRKACSVEAMTWYEGNCPNFKGGAF